MPVLPLPFSPCRPRASRWLLALSALLLTATASSAAPKPPKAAPSKLDAVIAELAIPDLDRRIAALKRLLALRRPGLTLAEGQQALRAAAQRFPEVRVKIVDPAAALVRVVAERPRPEYVPLVVSVFPKYDAGTRSEALRLLVSVPDRKAGLAFMELMRTHARKGGIPELPEMGDCAHPVQAAVLFPDLLEYLDDARFSFAVAQLCFSYCRDGHLPPATLMPHRARVLARYAAVRGKLVPAQRTQGTSWMWEERYLPLREEAALLLDFLSYFPAPEVEAELRKALEYRDPRLKGLGLISLLRQGREVDAKHVAEIAASAEMRNMLYNVLEERKLTALFPEQFRTQAAFAESTMVNWLTFPTELAEVPHEIELMKVIPVEDGKRDMYVFRFRMLAPHPAARVGWMAGIAGTFPHGGPPTTNSHGDTFSHFKPWEGKTAEEHLATFIGDADDADERPAFGTLR